MRSFRVFVSSPGDVAEERRTAHEILRALPEEPAWIGKIGIQVVRWDNPNSPTPMYANYSPQEAVNLHLPLPSQCDLVVLILWSRFGTPLSHPKRRDGTLYLSGTEWEYEDARDANVRILIFRRTDEPHVSLRNHDFSERQQQLGFVDAFFERLSGAQGVPTGGFIKYSQSEFETKFKKILESALRQMLEAEASGEGQQSNLEIIERLTRQLEEKEKENASLRQLVLRGRTVDSGERAADPEKEPLPVPTNQISVQVEDLDAHEAKGVGGQSNVVAVARVMPAKLIAPLKDRAELVAASPPWGISAVGAHTSPYSGANVLVAILDTGIDRTHAAFQGVELEERDFSGEGNGDVHGHGTHFAGIVFGRDVEGVRIGIARGIKRALIGKIVSREGCSTDVVVQAIQWALEEGADIIAMSIAFDTFGLERGLSLMGSGPELARAELLAAYRSNVVLFEQLLAMMRARVYVARSTMIVAAAGNDSQPGRRAPISMPAGTTDVVSVGSVAIASAGVSVAPFSNGGPVVVAPGVHIVSAKAGGGLVAMSGTSVSAAHAAGVAALWAEKFVRQSGTLLQPALIKAATTANLKAGTDPFDAGAGIVTAPQY